jgi:hypothetical protein
MRYLGMTQMKEGRVQMPDAFKEVAKDQVYEVVELGGNILLLPPPLDRERLALLEKLTRKSIAEHRQTLEGLAR